MARILVVEDDQLVRGLIVEVLRASEYETLDFPDAGPALERVDFSTIDLIVSDLEMPTPGDLFVRTIRERGIDVPVVVVSGRLDSERQIYLESLGVQGFVKKPFKLAELLGVVREWVTDEDFSLENGIINN